MLPQNELSAVNDDFGDSANLFFPVMFHSTAGGFNRDGLLLMRRIIDEVLSIPGIIDVNSGFEQFFFGRRGRELVAQPLLADDLSDWEQQDVDLFLERLSGSTISNNFFISPDRLNLTAFFTYDSAVEAAVLAEAVLAVIKNIDTGLLTVHASGLPFYEYSVRDYLNRDIPLLMGLSLIFILFIYYLGFRSRRAIILPTLIVLEGTIFTVGLMNLLDYPITVISIATPPLVLILGSSAVIHVLNQYYRELVDHDTSGDSLWIADAVSHVFKTIIVASVTTIVGFCSLLLTNLEQTKQMAIITSAGIAFCTLLAVTLLPAILALTSPPPPIKARQINFGLLAKGIGFLAGRLRLFVVPILLLLLAIPVVFYLLIGNLRFDFDYISYIPDDDPVIVDSQVIFQNIGDVVFKYITMQPSENDSRNAPRFFLDPEILLLVDSYEMELAKQAEVTYYLSFSKIIKEMNLVLNDRYEIPVDRGQLLYYSRVLGQMLQNEDESNYLLNVTNADFSRVFTSFCVIDPRTGLNLKDIRLFSFLDRQTDRMRQLFADKIDFNLFDFNLQFRSLYNSIRTDLARSVLLAAIVIFLITSLFFRRPTVGLLSLLPLAVAIFLNFTIMILLDIPLDMATIIVSAVANGVGVDDSVHFLITYQRQRRLCSDRFAAVAETLQETGRPIILTSISIMGGLLLMRFSSFRPIGYFGILVAIALLNATIGCLIFMPTLILIKAKFIEWRQKRLP